MRPASEACGKRHGNDPKRLLSSDRGAKPAVVSRLFHPDPSPQSQERKRKKEGGTPTDA
jgi:hypothetical protein